MLQNEGFITKAIPESLRNASPQRDLEYGSAVPGQSSETIATKYSTLKPKAGLMAMFVFVAGVPAAQDCGNPRCSAMFGQCVVASDTFKNDLKQTLREIASCPFAPLSNHLIFAGHVDT